MKYLLLFFCIVYFKTAIIIGQNIDPLFSARVDTSKSEIREISKLFKCYLNSRPDSAYQNPNWNQLDYDKYLRQEDNKLDLSGIFIFFGLNAQQFFDYYKPFVLQIDSIESNLYEIKTLYATEQPEREVIAITMHHARRDQSGDFKLENYRNYFTRNWKRVQHEFIEYVLAPGIEFNKDEANKAVSFCKYVANKFDIQILPFTYYVTSNTNELGRLFNFDYWVFGITGLSSLDLREVYTTYQNLNFPHEFVHILFPLRSKGFAPKMVNEGLATWLGGPAFNQTFDEALENVRADLIKFNNVTFERIRNQEIRNSYDSNILYVTGAVLCKLAYEKGGKNAIMQLWNSDDSNLNKTMETIFNKPYDKIGADIMNILKQAGK